MATLIYHLLFVQHLLKSCFCIILWYSWIQESQDMMGERGYESASKVWNGKEVIGIFHTLGITPATFDILKVHLTYLSL